jgi:hypothetical protein
MKEEYELEGNQMLGFMCLSPEHTGDVKRYLKKITEELRETP